ncbi:tail fiber protein [Oxalobacteraceae bacterium OTU3CINTB1]|nr:tail fiber protein [Oxalobacteraceae bacterium OTU3CINTB1]
MSQPYIGEIRIFAGNFPPYGWRFCDGAVLPINENDALFALIGTTYGGDGQQTFALPDLRGRVPVHAGANAGYDYLPGDHGGAETVTLTAAQMPDHTHAVGASTAAPAKAGAALDITTGAYVPGTPLPKPKLYGAPTALAPMYAGAVRPEGGGQPHDNMAPFLAINFIIALFGEFPSPY